MAKGVNFGGAIDYAYWSSELAKARNQADALNVVQRAMQASTAGFFNIGVTNNDQKTIQKIIEEYGTKYNTNVSGVTKYWNPSSNKVNSSEVNDLIKNSMEQLRYNTDTGTAGRHFGDTTTTDSNAGTSAGYATGSPNTTVNYYAVPETQKVNWQGKSTDELAELLGLETYKTADILQLYNNATNKKFDELDTQTKRAQAENLRTLEGQYENYLNTIREDRANAVANGMTKGMNAANQIATMYANASNINENQQAYSDALYDLGEQRATALEENAITAYQDRKSIEQYLASAAAQYEANSVNELAAKLAASAQVQAARTTADANIKAAGINYNATTAAQNMDWLVPYIVNAQKGDTVSQKILDIVQAHYGAN